MGIVDIDLSSLVNSASGLVNTIGNQIRGKVPVDLMEMAKLEAQIEQIKVNVLSLISKGDEGQSAINVEDSKSDSFFKSGWRSMAGWVCVFAMANNYLIMPITAWVLSFFMDKIPALLALDSGELITLLFGMLGLGTLRTYEKMKK